MWREEYRVDYAFVGDTLVMKETTDENRDTFFPPIGRETERALAEIERYAKKLCDGLRFGYLDNAAATAFSHRYPFVRIYSDRNWSDYLYRAEDMKYFRGKKLSGQRNHLNKFRKLYPNAVFSEISEDMIPSVREMLSAYEAENAEPGRIGARGEPPCRGAVGMLPFARALRGLPGRSTGRSSRSA